MLRAATNGFTYFLWVGSGKHKHHMRWWFFQSLEQRGLGWLREHVYFVENKHAMTAGVAKRRSFDQVAHVFYAVVTGGIQLQHVVAVAAVDCAARVAHAAWLAFLWVFAVQNFCQDAGGRSFARAARAAEQIGLTFAMVDDGVAQRAHHVLLAFQFVKTTGPIAAI